MRSYTGSKEARHISAAEAAGLVRSGHWVDYGVSLGQPDVFDKALAARKAELSSVKFRSCISMKPRAVLEADPEGERFFWFSWHFSGYDRKKHDAGISHYVPVNLGEIPGAIVETAKLVIVEVNERLPYVFGEQNSVHRSEVDYVIEGDHQPASELPNPPASEVDRAVGRLIAGEIEDGACLQIGIGGMPKAVCSMLLESGVRNLGVHTEMLTDGIIDLHRAGRVTGAAKTRHTGKITFSFALGSRDLYRTVDRNVDFCCCPVDHTNPPDVIMQNDCTVSINNTTQIDLQGQAASESDGHRHISGTGGQLQFVRGAYASRGGKSFICLASTYEKHGARKSRIVLNLTPGNVVTVPRSDTMYVVTEYGLANLKGKSVAERAKAVIALAHPDYREGLEREARENRLIPKGFV